MTEDGRRMTEVKKGRKTTACR